jgi:hypothetical protein
VIILDTDAVGHLQKGDPVGVMIRARLDASADRDLRITAVTEFGLQPDASHATSVAVVRRFPWGFNPSLDLTHEHVYDIIDPFFGNLLCAGWWGKAPP